MWLLTTLLCWLQVSLLVCAIYFVLGVLRLGFVTHFLSRPIISAFLTAGTIIISLSQVRSRLSCCALVISNVPETYTECSWPHWHLLHGMCAEHSAVTCIMSSPMLCGSRQKLAVLLVSVEPNETDTTMHAHMSVHMFNKHATASCALAVKA